jgi:hypothetical protein
MKDKRIVFDTSSEVTKKKGAKDINSEPEMKELKKIFGEMTGNGKTRTEQYLKDQDSNNTHPGDKI